LRAWLELRTRSSRRSSAATPISSAGASGCASSPLCQGGAEHYLRGRRGVWDLDVIVCFAHDSTLPRLRRRMVVSWDWGHSKLGRCPHDPPEYTGRAVDVAFWIIPDWPDPVAALREWLGGRAGKRPGPGRKPDLAHERVVLIRPDLGSLAWDPPNVPPQRPKAQGHRRPQGLAPRSPSSSVK
jgi:hypothetical protein